MNFELRRLQPTDLFSIVKMMNLIGFKTIRDAIDVNEINQYRKNTNEENRTDMLMELGAKVSMSVLDVVLENLPKIEKPLYSFLGSIVNMKPNDIAKMDIGDFMELLILIIKKEEFKDFFTQASKLIK